MENKIGFIGDSYIYGYIGDTYYSPTFPLGKVDPYAISALKNNNLKFRCKVPYDPNQMIDDEEDL